MTLFKIYEENRDTLNNDTYWGDVDLPLADLQELYKQSQLAIIDGVIAMVDYKIAIHKELEQQFVGSINAIKVNIREDNPHSFVIQNFEDLKDKLLAERKLIEENK